MRGILIGSVLVTTLLYLFVSLLSVSAYPPEYENWLAYIRDMGNLTGMKAVPAFYAAHYYLGQTGIWVLMLALFGVILTGLIGNMLALSRLLYAAGRDGEAPQTLSELNRSKIPHKAIAVVVAVSVLMPFLGRTAIGWIVDVTTLGATLIYGMISYIVFKCARQEQQHLETYTGVAGVVLMVCFGLLLLIPGILPFHAMETESYILFIVWSVLGLVYFRLLLRRDKNREYGQRVMVWILLLMLVLFASVMWVSRATEDAAHNAVERIYEYHQSHPAADLDDTHEMSREQFLQKQADEISDTNILYAVVSMGLFFLSIAIIMNNYQENKALGERLLLAESEARAAKKIAKLKESVSTLFNNMPALSFSKDAQTGRYLACNQAFAEYANKEAVEDVIGLTDADIFDPVTAAHFTEADQVALSMDVPYIFYEEALDAVGNQRQFQTTRLKYVDENGRSCILGMCQDVTEMVRVQRKNVQTKEAYEKARNSGIIFTHIAQTLARGYEDLYYINLENGDYIEYSVDEDTGMLVEERRGEDFFMSCIREAERTVHPEDRGFLMDSLQRDTLIDTLNRNKSLIMTYRLMQEEESVYVSMKVSRMEDDERFIILGITNVNEEMKQRRLMERVKEEHIAYARINALAGDFICVYVVVPENGIYREFSSTEGYKSFEVPVEGKDFFEECKLQGRKVVCPDDLDYYLTMFTMENVLSEIEQNGMFSMTYRLMMDGKPNYVQLKAAMVEESEGARLIVGLNDIDAHVRREEEYAMHLAQAQNMANIDALTGVKNRHAYLDEEARLNHLISEHRISEFAVVILDVNNLKYVNDTFGHQAGDEYIQNACKIICDIFGHSPVFRTGGDEFAVVVQTGDYACIEELVGKLSDHNSEAIRNDGIVIACGMARFENDECVAAVFERADQSMYENKSSLKETKARLLRDISAEKK